MLWLYKHITQQQQNKRLIYSFLKNKLTQKSPSNMFKGPYIILIDLKR